MTGNLSGRPEAGRWSAAPNVVSLLRLALVAPAVLLLAAGLRAWSVAVILLMFATDWLDGYLARRLDSVTELGKVLDPLADKVAVGALLIYLTATGQFPPWALGLVVARDVAIALGGLAIVRRSGSVPQALMAGKIALVVLAAAVVVFVADIRTLEPAALVALTAAVVVSGAVYAVEMTRRKSEPAKE